MEKDNQGHEGVWRTIRGRRVFIRSGEDLESAMKRSGKFGTKFSPEETENLRKAGREARAKEIDKINNDNKYITENEQKDKLKEISGGAISTLQTTTPRSKAERLKPGAEIYYKGDQANTPGYFTVEKFEPEKEQFLASVTLKEKGGENRTLKIGSQSIEDNYTNNYARRFAFKEDYDNYRNQVFENYRKIAEDAKNKNNDKYATEAQVERFKERKGKQSEDFSKVNEKAEISFGKIDAYGNGRKSNEATVRMSLKDGVFSASGDIWNSKHTDIISGGQNLDEMREHLKGNKDFETIHSMWKKYHLNDMHAGTEKQEKALEKKFGGVNANKYSEQVEYLKSIGLYEDNGYKYGTGWLKRDIPEADLKTIVALIRKYNK